MTKNITNARPTVDTDARYDVFIYNMETNVIETVGGISLSIQSGFHTVGKRVDTILSRINLDRYSVIALPAGQYKKGDTLSEEALRFEIPSEEGDD